jgi:Tfp pilus assembly protein PilO
MNETPAKSGLHRAILKQLGHPLKLRLVLCTTMLTVWYFLFFSPLSERVVATTSRIAVERKRVVIAREIEQLKKSLAPYRDVVGSIDVHELMRHVMRRIRSSPLRLIDLKPERPKDLGPYEAIGLRLSLEGAYADIDEFLGWAERDRRLIRIDAVQLMPHNREKGRLSAQITLLALAEKSVGATKPKAEAGKKP